MSKTANTGRRFSHLYLGGGEPVSDSPRMRRRLSIACPVRLRMHKHLEAELGVHVMYRESGRSGPAGISASFFEKAALRDILDAVTLIYGFIQPYYAEGAAAWLSDVRRVFKEERLAYSVDDAGGVHFAVDSNFESVQASTLSSLGGSRYANAASMFEHAMRSLDSSPPNGKAAIRDVFASAEGLFRVMFPNAARLGAAEAEQHLGPELAKLYAADATARRAALKLLGSFKAWIDGAHFYRHEPGQEEVAQPPLGLTVLLLQEGAGYIRWLAQIDQNHG